MEEGAGLFLHKELVDDLVEDEADELEDPKFETECGPLGTENTAAPHHPCPRKERSPDAQKARTPTTVRDRVQACQLRRSLDLLDRAQEEKDLFLQKTREELCACHHRMDVLSKQQASVAAQVAQERKSSNMAAVGRLQAASRRLHLELEGERDLHARLGTVLQESENTMWHLEVKKGQLEGVRKCNREEAKAREGFLRAHTAQQLRREEEASGKAERNRRLRIRRSLHTQRELGLRHQKLVEDAQKNHRVAVKFLKASLGRIRERERQEELESHEHLQRRMEAVLALKNSIATNRETLRKFQAWGRARAEQEEQQAQAEQQAVLAQGRDAFKHLSHQRRRQELEAQRRAFEEEQKLRKQEIVSRILKEEAQEESLRKRQRPPAKATALRTLRDRTWSYIAAFCEGKAAPVATRHSLDLQAVMDPMSLLLKASSESMQMMPAATNLEEETLAEPEIPGLWSEDHRQYQVPKEDMDRKPVGGTKMDKDILACTLERLRSGVVHKQVASGREFKGRPFNSKPEHIHFKDFDVGKVYKKKITLINATYTLNYCKLVGVEQHLRDFIRVDFDPPGPLSAGMSCEVLVTFKPMINRDLEGSVSFLAQTGGFSVPLKCSTKKCSLSLDKKLISFGSYVVGETTSRTITLTNAGGLGTAFQVLPASEPFELEDSQSVLKVSSLYTLEDRNLTLGVSDTLLEASTSSLPGSQSQKESVQSEELKGAPTASGVVTIPSEAQAEIMLGEVTEGEIGPFSSVRVPVLFTPALPGEVQARFQVVFKNPQCPTLYFRATGVAVDVPVWVPRPNVDLKICMYDRLYQDSVLVRSRSKAALRLRFEVCKELRGHLELLPETGYIQALASCSVQLKFLPRQTLPEDARNYFDKDSRVLEAPMTIWVADQTKPVGFTVHAIVTTSDLELRPSSVDFGYCTIYEAIRTSVSLCNHSLLPQEFGFVGLPKFIDIQPNDGFGTILPLETLQLDVLFQPTKAREYSFQLVCKSEINRCFKLSCQAVGVHPPLELSHYQIKFAATALYDTSVASLYVINSHLATSSLPRGASPGDLCPVGPTSFEFLLPPDAPIAISPLVGSVLPGKRCLVRVAFQPTLPHQLVSQEALQTPNKETQAKPLQKDAATQRKDMKVQDQAGQGPTLQKQELEARAEEYQAAQATLARTFQGRFDKFVVPCVVASGDVKDRNGLEPLSFSPHNTLYLELWCPAVAPAIVVTSDRGKTIINFGNIAVGQRSLKRVSLQNTCPEDLALDFSVLNPRGPFFLVNTPSKLRAGKTRVLAVSFSPQESVLAQEVLEIITKRGTLALTLLGAGVASVITCSLDGDVLDMGYVLARESVSTSFKLQNDSSLPIKFSMRLDSLSGSRASAQQELPKFLTSGPQRTDVVGTQNHSGQSVFSVVPVAGVLDPGRAQDFTVTFSPDHESLYFSDQLQVVLFEKKVSHQIRLKGAAREHMMFVEGGDPLDVPVESLTVIPASDPEHREGELSIRKGQGRTQPHEQLGDPSTPRQVGVPVPQRRAGDPGCHPQGQAGPAMHRAQKESTPNYPACPGHGLCQASVQHPPSAEAEELKPVLLTLNYVQLDTHQPAPPATRELQVGCIRTTQPALKKTVEFSLDGITWLQHKGFSIEPARGFLDRGQTKTINVSWVPPADFDPDQALMVSTLLQLKGDVKENYKVIFVAHVVTGL
ncbi:PREDICTED: cilia- and flagella-associated protein 74 isoform X5 [Chinchilla lanigera]|nr:PREDICTED: cilia- and flagella-associated protein 74 isoform X5 [Chinchilla lanigera]XP_013359684.1 PREDICTED: cilia- and flagella-associated protein 74 isoform X5 [Chinchilla lanigera]